MRSKPAVRLHAVAPPAQVTTGAQESTTRPRMSAGLPGWIRSLTTRRALLLGAIACYALILFNLLYGIATLARLKSLRPLPAVSAAEPQRQLAAVAAATLPPSMLDTASPLAGAGVTGPCTFDSASERMRQDGRGHAGSC